MINIKRRFYIPAVIGIWMGIAGLASCNHTPSTGQLSEQKKFAPPVTRPLLFGKSKKIDWAAIKSVRIKPPITNFDINKLPLVPYEGSGLKPFTNGVEEKKIDFDALPQKDLDIDKLPSKPLKFKTYNLPPPKLVGTGPPHLKDTSQLIYELGEAQGIHEDKEALCLLNDREGFLWIGTTKGIYRYDGQNMLLYASGIGDKYIASMMEDQAGRIWIAILDEGLEILDPAAGTLQKTNTSLGLGSNNPKCIVQDKQQRIWMSVYQPGGVNIIDTKTQTVKWLNRAQGLSGKAASGIILDEDNDMWIATSKGLSIIDLVNKKIKYLDKNHGLSSDSTYSLMQDHKGNMYVGMFGGMINVLNAKKQTIDFVGEGEAHLADAYGTIVVRMIEDNRGWIWAITNDNGVTVIDRDKRKATHLLKQTDFGQGYIKSITKDNRGQVWIAGQTGLVMFSNNKALIEQIGKTPTTALAEDDQGLVWQGSYYTGVNIIDRKNATVRNFSRKNGLENDTLENMRAMGGKMFITTNGGMDIVDLSKSTLTHFGTVQCFSNKVPDAAVVDGQGKIWIGCRGNGIDIYDPATNTLKRLGKAGVLPDNEVIDMNMDLQGNIWISTLYGTTVIDPETGVIRYPANKPLTVHDQRCFLPDGNGNMWISTLSGAYKVDIKNKTLTSFSTPQGLTDEMVISILKYGNHIYACTASGITVLTPPAANKPGDRNWQVESFGKEYGLNKKAAGYETDFVTRDGLYWWGDVGLKVLDLSAKEHVAAPVYITGINIMDEPAYFAGRGHAASNGIKWDSIGGPGNAPVNLQLAYDQNYLRFNYSSINLANRDTTWYRYSLAGAGKNWNGETISTVGRNFFNLAPGKYTFEVSAKDAGNNWGKPAILSFTVNPPWWQTWWAYVIYVLLFAGSIWSFSYYRSLSLLKEKQVLEHKVTIRTKEVIEQKEEIESQRDNLEKAFSELKATQNQLIQREKMASLGELTAGIAHEIQNPLNFVNNFSEVNVELLQELKGESTKAKAERDEQQEIELLNNLIENESKINQHGRRADAIVKGMLQHSKTSTGVAVSTNINSLADEYMRLAYHGLRSKDKDFNAVPIAIGMVTNFDAALPMVNVIPQDIGRVLLNLFNNAFYAVNIKLKTEGAGYKPEVSVSTSAENNNIIIKVKDNGNGIPDAIKDKIMQPFFTTKPTGEGTGLGLSLSYDIVVKGHGGTIGVETAEGKLTVFTVTLPIA